WSCWPDWPRPASPRPGRRCPPRSRCPSAASATAASTTSPSSMMARAAPSSSPTRFSCALRAGPPRPCAPTPAPSAAPTRGAPGAGCDIGPAYYKGLERRAVGSVTLAGPPAIVLRDGRSATRPQAWVSPDLPYPLQTAAVEGGRHYQVRLVRFQPGQASLASPV